AAVALRDHWTLHPAAGDLPGPGKNRAWRRRRDPVDGRAARAGAHRRVLRLRFRREALRRRREAWLSEGDCRLRAAPSRARRGVSFASRSPDRRRSTATVWTNASTSSTRLRTSALWSANAS